MFNMDSAIVCGRLCFAPKGDSYVQCSFDPSHIILRSKMPTHIVKCRANHPNHNKVQCLYDACEYVDPHDFAQHLINCQSRRFDLEPKKLEDISGYKNYQNYKAKINLPKNLKNLSSQEVSNEIEECWDEETTKTNSKSSEDLDDDLPYDKNYLGRIRGVGRANDIKRPDCLEKGGGRAKFLEKLSKLFEERDRLAKPSTSDSKPNFPEGQFLDA